MASRQLREGLFTWCGHLRTELKLAGVLFDWEHWEQETDGALCGVWLLQPPLAQGEGPVSLIMAPTRELVVQIGKDIRRFSKALSLSIVCAYGGSAVAGQISDLKRGAEVHNPIHLSPLHARSAKDFPGFPRFRVRS